MSPIMQMVSLLTALIMAAPRAALTQARPEPERDSKTATIARAMRAAPPAITEHATIADIDGTVLRRGTNGWTCRPGLSAADSSPMCNDEVWVKLMAALDAKAPFHTDRVGVSYMLAGDAVAGSNTDPYATKPAPGEPWVREGPHLMIVFPDPKQLTGISTDPNNGGPYVMWQGTPYVHVMVPVGPRPKPRP